MLSPSYLHLLFISMQIFYQYLPKKRNNIRYGFSLNLLKIQLICHNLNIYNHRL